MRARTQGGTQPSVAAADNFQVDAGVEAEAALHVEHTAHSGEFSTAAAGEQAGALGGLENISQEAAAAAALDAGLGADGEVLPHMRDVQPDGDGGCPSEDASGGGRGKGGSAHSRPCQPAPEQKSGVQDTRVRRLSRAYT